MADDFERDYCDLDPTKICDNCCRCIEDGKEYNDMQIELTDTIATLDEITRLPFDDSLYDEDADEESIDPAHVAPLDIDPALMAEWERKLRIAQIEDAQKLIRTLHGQRRLSESKKRG